MCLLLPVSINYKVANCGGVVLYRLERHMTQLVEALQQLGLQGEISLSGRWVKLDGEVCGVYVVEAVSGTRFYTWCDDPQERAVELYHEPEEAIKAGLRRASRVAHNDNINEHLPPS